jgi:hypothetical protein
VANHADDQSAQIEAERQFRAAQFAVAKIQPRDANELMLMAQFMTTRRCRAADRLVGYQVALSYVRLYGAAIGGAA